MSTPHGPGDRHGSVEDELRASLRRHADEAPDGLSLADRILAAVDQPDRFDEPGEHDPRVVPLHHRADRRAWRVRALPCVAAAAVLAVIAGVVSLTQVHSGPPRPQAAHTGVPSMRSTQHAIPFPSASSYQTHSAAPRKITTSLTDVKIADLTFIGANKGYALATANCLDGPGICTALLYTTNGRTWKSSPNVAFDVPGTTKGCPANECVEHIRFVNTSLGYAYGTNAFFMTTDGGQVWTQESGGAVALEALDGNVIRMRENGSAGCPPGCTYTVQTANNGSPDWTTVTLPGGAPIGDSVQLTRGGYPTNSDAYLLVRQNPAGGSSDAQSTLYRSADDGASWHRVGEPCAQDGSTEVDSYAVTAGEGSDVTVVCRARTGSAPWTIAVSTDGGRHFATRGQLAASAVNADGSSVLAGDPDTSLVVAGSDGISYSTDGGRQWQTAAGPTGAFGWVGFENGTVGRALSADGREIWTTTDAGRTWTAATLS